MASSALSANSYVVTTASSSKFYFRKFQNGLKKRHNFNPFKIRCSSEDTDCNTEECAPDKEVGKVSMEWLAGEKTKVVGTFPPLTRGWTGYVEKDTAGQTNIYSVEPAVYVAESAISSGRAGSSSDGSENTLAVAGGIALFSVAAASVILLQVGKTPPQIQTLEYSGPSLSYYISKFKPTDTVELEVSPPIETITSTALQSEALAPIEATTSTSSQSESSNPEVPKAEIQQESFEDSSIPISNVS